MEFLDALRRRDNGKPGPVIIIAAKDLAEADRHRLKGGLERILQKGTTSGAHVPAEVRAFLSGQIESTI